MNVTIENKFASSREFAEDVRAVHGDVELTYMGRYVPDGCHIWERQSTENVVVPVDTDFIPGTGYIEDHTYGSTSVEGFTKVRHVYPSGWDVSVTQKYSPRHADDTDFIIHGAEHDWIGEIGVQQTWVPSWGVEPDREQCATVEGRVSGFTKVEKE